MAAYFSLHITSFAGIIRARPGVAHALDQIGEFQQIPGTKTRPAIGERKERIRRGQIGPGNGQRGALTVPVTKIHSVFPPAMAAFDRRKLLIKPRVEWMGNAKGSARTCCIACSW